jgi:hypothetical protein
MGVAHWKRPVTFRTADGAASVSSLKKALTGFSTDGLWNMAKTTSTPGHPAAIVLTAPMWPTSPGSHSSVRAGGVCDNSYARQRVSIFKFM